MKNALYIAATSQHVGKTTMTLGMLAALKHLGRDVGYCKPMGQQFLSVDGQRVDKDAVLFANSLPFELDAKLHSPVILGPGDTNAYLANPQPEILRNSIREAAKVLSNRHDLMLYEGTGHPGVGSVVDLSNADVAHLLETDVVLVIEGGIGNTIDRLTLCEAVFRLAGVRISGVIMNKVLVSKREKVRAAVQPWLEKRGIRLLGLIPYDEELVYPTMQHVVKSVNGNLVNQVETMDRLVHETIAGVSTEHDSETPPENQLLVVSRRRFPEALHNHEAFCRAEGIPTRLAGAILTGRGRIYATPVRRCQELDIPVVSTEFDTYQAVVHLSQFVAKIDTQTPSKIERAITLFEENIDMPALLSLFEAKS